MTNEGQQTLKFDSKLGARVSAPDGKGTATNRPQKNLMIDRVFRIGRGRRGFMGNSRIRSSPPGAPTKVKRNAMVLR
jgi:hypothetical protein